MNAQQSQQIASSVILSALAIMGTALVTKGVMTTDQANVLESQVGAALIGIFGAVVMYWQTRQHTPAAVAAALPSLMVQKDPALITAVVAAANSPSVPGVKVVSDTSPGPQVIIDSKGIVRTDPKAAPPSKP